MGVFDSFFNLTPSPQEDPLGGLSDAQAAALSGSGSLRGQGATASGSLTPSGRDAGIQAVGSAPVSRGPSPVPGGSGEAAKIQAAGGAASAGLLLVPGVGPALSAGAAVLTTLFSAKAAAKDRESQEQQQAEAEKSRRIQIATDAASSRLNTTQRASEAAQQSDIGSTQNLLGSLDRFF